MSEICGPICQHPSCWSAERNKLRRELYARNGYVQQEEGGPPPLPKEPDDSRLPTYKIVHLGDTVVIPSPVLKPKRTNLERGLDSRTTCLSAISGANTTNHGNYQGDLSRTCFPAGRSHSASRSRASPRLVTSLSSAKVSRTLSALSPGAGDNSEDQHGTLQKTDRCLSVLTVRHGGCRGQYHTFLPPLIWVPSKKKRKKIPKNADQGRDGKVAIQCFDGSYLWHNWNNSSKAENTKANQSSEYKVSSRISFRKLPPLDTKSNSSRKVSFKEQLTYPKALNQETASESLQTPEPSLSIALRIPTPNNTRNSRRHSYPLESCTQIFKLTTVDQNEDTCVEKDRDATGDGNIESRMVHTENAATKTSDRRRDPIKQPLKLPRVSLPKTSPNEMSTTHHHCRNSVPHYTLPNVWFKPLDVADRTPSVASTESLIGKIFVKFGYKENKVRRALLDADVSSVEAYEKLLDEFPDLNLNEYDTASGSMNWSFKEDALGQLQSPADARDQRSLTPSSFMDDNQGGLGQQEVLAGLTMTNECNQTVGSTVRFLTRKTSISGDVDAAVSEALSAQEGDIESQPSETPLSDRESFPSASFHSEGELHLNRGARTSSMEKVSSSAVLASCELESPVRDEFKRKLLLGSESYAFERYHTTGEREPGKRQLIWKSQSLPHVNQFTDSELYQDFRVLDGHRFKSTKNKLPPLLMWTPSRVPPHPGHQPSAEQVPDELMVSTMGLSTKSKRSDIDLCPSLTVTQLPYNKSDATFPEVQRYKTGVGSMLSPPIIVPTMSPTESTHSTKSIHLSPLKSQSAFHVASDSLRKEGVTEEHGVEQDDGRETDEAKTVVCSLLPNTEREVDANQESTSEKGENDDVTLSGLSPMETSPAVSPDFEQGSAGLRSFSLQERELPLGDPYSSPLLTNAPDLMIDLQLNLEDELRKAVSGLEGFSFNNFDIESVLSLDLDSAQSEIVNDIVLTDNVVTEKNTRRNLISRCSTTSDPSQSRKFGRTCMPNDCSSPENSTIVNSPR